MSARSTRSCSNKSCRLARASERGDARDDRNEVVKPVLGSAWFWLATWALTMIATVAIMSRVRQRELERFQQPDQAAAWDAWRSAAAAGGGPVARRTPKSDEPPTLRLLRDHYAVCLGGMLVFESVFLGFLGLLVCGMLADRHARLKSPRSRAEPLP